jgi:ankyrin repeat protein
MGNTALNGAAKNGHKDVCALLLENGANVMAKAIVSWKSYAVLLGL